MYPFGLFNYIAGLSSIRFSHYAIATVLGRIPGVFLYVWFSSTLTAMRPRDMLLAGTILLFFLLLGVLVRKKFLPQEEFEGIERT